MPEYIVKPFDDAESVSRAAADEFVLLARESISRGGSFRVALSGGSTPKRLCQLLAADPYRGQVDWTRIEVFWGDERAVPPDHQDSNYRMANEALLRHVPVPRQRIHRIEGERVDRDAAARDYEAEIARVFGVSPGGAPPPFDLVFLGMGADGHTASLFPHTAGLKETRRWVVAHHVEKLQSDRVTLTYPILNRAARVVFLAAGTDKTVPLAEVLEGPEDAERLPSQRINPGKGKLFWFVDRAAAAKLTRMEG